MYLSQFVTTLCSVFLIQDEISDMIVVDPDMCSLYPTMHEQKTFTVDGGKVRIHERRCQVDMSKEISLKQKLQIRKNGVADATCKPYRHGMRGTDI